MTNPIIALFSTVVLLPAVATAEPEAVSEADLAALVIAADAALVRPEASVDAIGTFANAGRVAGAPPAGVDAPSYRARLDTGEPIAHAERERLRAEQLTTIELATIIRDSVDVTAELGSLHERLDRLLDDFPDTPVARPTAQGSVRAPFQSSLLVGTQEKNPTGNIGAGRANDAARDDRADVQLDSVPVRDLLLQSRARIDQLFAEVSDPVSLIENDSVDSLDLEPMTSAELPAASDRPALPAFADAVVVTHPGAVPEPSTPSRSESVFSSSHAADRSAVAGEATVSDPAARGPVVSAAPVAGLRDLVSSFCAAASSQTPVTTTRATDE